MKGSGVGSAKRSLSGHGACHQLLDNIVEQCTLLIKDLADPLLDTVWGEVGEHLHGAGLPDPMGTILSLRLDRRIPPTVEMEHHRGCGQVQPHTPGPK
jgi:hypothetical protein